MATDLLGNPRGRLLNPVLDVPLTEQVKYLAVWLAYDALSILEILLHG